MALPIGHASAAHMPVREMPAHRAFVVRLQGDYAALELAWYCAMQRLTIEKFKSDQRLPPFETYLVTSATERSNDCVTEVNIPLLVSN
jgi:DNA gyrase inhibitor GyrI